MFDFIRSLFGSGAPSSAGEKTLGEAVTYEGCTIRVIEMKNQGQYQTCAHIEAEIDGQLHAHRLIRADLHASSDGAVEFSIFKAKRMIDEQGTRFLEPVVTDESTSEEKNPAT